MAAVAGSINVLVNMAGNKPKTITNSAKIVGAINISFEASCADLGNA